MTDHSLQTINTKSPKIAIIGGGLTGLFTATLLERAFSQGNDKILTPNITIFEKSRSVGRLATRYRTDSHTGKNWQWAFGAQFFTAKTANFQQFIAPWLKTGLLQPWCAQVVNLTPANDSIESSDTSDIQSKEQWNTSQARYISTPKMTSWGRELADELQHTSIRFKTRVAPLAQYDNTLAENTEKQTELFDETGASLGWFDWVICTAPNGQAVELMADSGFTQQARIDEPKMQACYTLMLGWDESQKLPSTISNQPQPQWDVAYVNSAVIDRIFIEHQKPAHSDLLPSITIHARNDWSEQHVDDEMEAVKEHLLLAAQQSLHWDEDTTPSQTDCHRWRYAATVADIDSDAKAKEGSDAKEIGILVDETKQWIVSGDWCAKGNIESCYQMAQETVEVIQRN